MRASSHVRTITPISVIRLHRTPVPVAELRLRAFGKVALWLAIAVTLAAYGYAAWVWVIEPGVR